MYAKRLKLNVRMMFENGEQWCCLTNHTPESVVSFVVVEVGFSGSLPRPSALVRIDGKFVECSILILGIITQEA